MLHKHPDKRLPGLLGVASATTRRGKVNARQRKRHQRHKRQLEEQRSAAVEAKVSAELGSLFKLIGEDGEVQHLIDNLVQSRDYEKRDLDRDL